MNQIPTNGGVIPPQIRDVYFIEPVESMTRIKTVVYSPTVWGVWTHYDKVTHTTICYRNHEHCVNGHDPKTLRWKGYILGHNAHRTKVTYFQLTARAIYDWYAQFIPGTTLRGQIVYISRGKKNNSPLRVELSELHYRGTDALPPDVDPRASIYNMLKTPDPGWQWAIAPVAHIADLEEAG